MAGLRDTHSDIHFLLALARWFPVSPRRDESDGLADLFSYAAAKTDLGRGSERIWRIFADPLHVARDLLAPNEQYCFENTLERLLAPEASRGWDKVLQTPPVEI